MIDLTNPDFFGFNYVFEGALDSDAHDVGDLGVDTTVAFVFLVFREGEVEVGGLIDGGGFEGLVTVEEFDLVFFVAECCDDTDELDEDTLVGVGALGAEGDDTLDGFCVLEDVHLFGSTVIRIIDGSHFVTIFTVELEFNFTTVNSFHEASEKRFLFLLRWSLMIEHLFLNFTFSRKKKVCYLFYFYIERQTTLFPLAFLMNKIFVFFALL